MYKCPNCGGVSSATRWNNKRIGEYGSSFSCPNCKKEVSHVANLKKISNEYKAGDEVLFKYNGEEIVGRVLMMGCRMTFLETIIDSAIERFSVETDKVKTIEEGQYV